jgi:hypothetical protein
MRSPETLTNTSAELIVPRKTDAVSTRGKKRGRFLGIRRVDALILEGGRERGESLKQEL